MRRPKILFVADAVTLAHIGRLYALADSLDPNLYEIAVASASTYDTLLPTRHWKRFNLKGMSSSNFLNNARAGKLPYTKEMLYGYVEDDLRIISEFKPDLIVNDWRHSMAISARLKHVPYMTLINAHWSPYAQPNFMMPDLPMSRWLGPKLTNILFKIGRKAAFALLSRPHNQARKHFGVPTIPPDLRHVFCDADLTLYPDVPEQVPTFDRPDTHHYIGPINWCANVPLPDWWSELPANEPIIFVSLGSSGDPALLPNLLKGISHRTEPICVVSTGANIGNDLPKNIFVASFLPADAMMERACLLICNGGIMSHHALEKGIPVLCVPSNLDQYLCTHYISRVGAGIMARSQHTSSEEFGIMADALLQSSQYRNAAQKMSRILSRSSYKIEFPRLVKNKLSSQP
jgi:UDP:flavonoid glycosyltransferase YjiC (YdhE family)